MKNVNDALAALKLIENFHNVTVTAKGRAYGSADLIIRDNATGREYTREELERGE